MRMMEVINGLTAAVYHRVNVYDDDDLNMASGKIDEDVDFGQ